MPVINLKYGRTEIPFDYDDSQFEILGAKTESRALSDAELGNKLDNPTGSKTLEEIINPGETVLIVVPDATRQTACGQVINLVVRRLIAGGTEPFDIRIIFATGIHRPVTEAEKVEILTPFIAQRVKSLDHGPRDLMQILHLGETSNGIPVGLNRALVEHDHVILLGGVTFHYFAGFTGGRKLICPGLAASKTIAATHKLAFDCERRDRRDGVGTGLLDGNAVHEAFVEAASRIDVSFCVSTIVNDSGEAVDLFCGDWIESHRAACDTYASGHAIEIAEKRDIVIASCGGYPHDINLIQGHKALDAASNACNEGGTIVFVAECSQGLGRDNFLNWFESENSDALAARLCENYQVNGQTAWSLMRKAERFDIRIITSLLAQSSEAMRLTPMQSLSRVMAKMNKGSEGYILPFGAKTQILTPTTS